MKAVHLARSGIKMARVVWHFVSACSLFFLTIIFYMAASGQRAEDDVTPRLRFGYGKTNTQTRIHSSSSDYNCVHHGPHLK